MGGEHRHKKFFCRVLALGKKEVAFNKRSFFTISGPVVSVVVYTEPRSLQGRYAVLGQSLK